MEERVFYRELGCLFNDESGGSGLAATYMKMGHMYLMTKSKFLEDIMVSRGNRMMDIVLSGHKENFHNYHAFPKLLVNDNFHPVILILRILFYQRRG
jgi:hypothetical protein